MLDAGYLDSLGRFDVVYSWGVLHHTGDMWTALDNARRARRAPTAGCSSRSTTTRAQRSSDVARGQAAATTGCRRAARVPFVLAVMGPRELLSAAKSLGARPAAGLRARRGRTTRARAA